MNKRHGLNTQMWHLIEQTCIKGSYCHKEFKQFFGYLFKKGDQQKFTEEELKNLSLQMKGDTNELDSEVPIGMAYFGQFIDHDITFETVSNLGKVAGDVGKIHNLRTPKLELDSVYLNGPESSPYLYEKNAPEKLIIGTKKNPFDLQRNSQDTAIIGDPRNDENIFINQLHGLFIRFHNWVVEQGKNFEQAREFVVWTYQKAVVEEFLPAFVDSNVLNPYINGFENENKLPGPVNWSKQSNMPIEFSAAAFRFGHSVIREDYKVNKATSGNLFKLRKSNSLPTDLNLTWKYFFDVDGENYLKCKPIDTKLIPGLFNLPTMDNKNLAFRNLNRGQRTFGLLTGEQIAKKLNRKPIDTGLKETPLWFYILAEAEQHNGKLGFVGGSIVAGVLLQLLLADEESYICKNPNFNPFELLPYEKSILASIIEAVEEKHVPKMVAQF